MKQGNQKQICSILTAYNAQVQAESLIAIALAYSAPLPVIATDDQPIFYIHNVMTVVSQVACDINELQIVDVSTIEQLAKDAWKYRVAAMSCPQPQPHPGLEGWTVENYSILQQIMELTKQEYGVSR